MRRVNQQVQNQTILFRIKSLQMSNEPFSSLIISLLIIWLIRRWMFLEVEFGRVGMWIGWFDWMRGWLGVGRRCSYARVYERSRTRSFVFCCHKCHSGWNRKYFIIPKTTCRFMESDVSFYRKQRVVLLKTTCRFVESDGLFWGGDRKVVLRMVFWGFLGVE